MKSVASAVVLLVVTTMTSAQFSLVASFPVLPAPSPSFSVLQNPTALVDDIAFTESSIGGISLLHVISFLPGSSQPVVETTSSSIGPGHILGGDMNGDGARDLVVAGTSLVLVLLKTPTGYAPAGPAVPLVGTSNVPETSRLVDWDGDGDLDYFYHAHVALNDGGGVLGTPVVLVPAVAGIYQFNLDLADADGDGDYDILFAGQPSTLYLNVAGTLVAGPILPTVGVICTVKFLDFDLDGIMDLWAYCKDPVQPAIVTARGLGGGAFAPSVFSPMAPLAVSGFFSNNETIELIDVDGSGDLEATILSTQTPFTISSAAFLFDVTTNGTLVPWGGGQAITTGKNLMRAGRFVPGAGMDLAFLLRNFGMTPSWIEIHNSIAAPIAYTATVVSGNGQTATSAAPTANPVVVRVDDAVTGAPAPGIGVTLWLTGGVTAQAINGFTSDALGEVRFTLLGGAQTGSYTIGVLVLGELSALVNVNVGALAALSVISPNPTAIFVGGGPVPPLVIRALQTNGLPLGGAAVQCVATSPLSLSPSSQSVVTDAFGYATIVVNPPTNPGAGTVTATLGVGPAASVATVQVGVRRLTIPHPSPSILGISYAHEDGPTPLLIAADLPRPIVPTPFGGVATSVLAPLPGLIVLDGLGAFGPPDPAIVATPSFSRVYTNVPAALLGLTLVFQAYGFDFSYPYPAYVFISPPVTVTL